MTERVASRRRDLEFRYERFRELVEPLGYRKIEEQWRFLGVSESTFWRARQGDVGEQFVAATVAALPKCTFDELFRTKAVAA